MNGIFDWVDTDGRFRLALMPRPPGGQRLDFAMRALRAHDVDVLVSLQTEPEAEACGLAREAEAAEAAGMVFLRHAIPDHGVPTDRGAALACVDELLGRLDRGQSVLLHCFAGIGRSGLIAVAILLRAGYDYDDAAYRVMAARKLRVPETREQEAWLHRLARPLDDPE